MTCICGHHEKAHHESHGCVSPDMCDCYGFRKASPEPTPLVDADKAKQDAEWLAGSEADTAERNLARAYLAMCDEVAGFTAMWEEREKAHDAEIAEAKREGAREALTAYAEVCDVVGPYWFRDDRYPAAPSVEGVAKVGHDDNKSPQPWTCQKCGQSGDVWTGCGMSECEADVPESVRRAELAKRYGWEPATPQPEPTRQFSPQEIAQARAVGTHAINFRAPSLEGCGCNRFREAAPEPTPFVDHAKAKQDAEWLLGSEADTAERNLARAYLVMLVELAEAKQDTARLDWFDRIWIADDIHALDAVWQSSTGAWRRPSSPGPAGSGRAAIDAAMVAMPTTETPE